MCVIVKLNDFAYILLKKCNCKLLYLMTFLIKIFRYKIRRTESV